MKEWLVIEDEYFFNMVPQQIKVKIITINTLGAYFQSLNQNLG